uniref:Putative site-specific DNA endonuclease n=1 Tax=Tupiella akineta TaxID=160070 RepID=Q3ZJ57_TUPAK|nr:putative site-specific DNA endonuclease [Tupiella akineta]AAV80634.1 putative site-specific DNA endonuclease [Tupiella akineta]
MTYPSIPFYYRPNILLVSNSLTQSLLLNQEYKEIVQTTVDQIIKVFESKRLPYEPFRMLNKRNSKSGISNKSGIYLIFNIQTQGIYLGETLNFATRKATYMQEMREAKKRNEEPCFQKMKVSQEKLTIIKLVHSGQAVLEDFLFVPVVISDVTQFKDHLTNEKAKNSDINKFLIEIESIVLIKLLTNKFTLYNQKFGGLFEKRNSFGGSPKSGTPPAHLKIGDIAFESVSCAAKSLNVHSKTIRNYIIKFETIDYLTQKQWQNWVGKKVLKGNEKVFWQHNKNFRNIYYRVQNS